PHALGGDLGFEVLLLQEYLGRELPRIRQELGAAFPHVSTTEAFRLFGHCTERTAAPRSQKLWQTVFSELGARLELESVGCCGMCGVYGHERIHLDESRGIFDMSWRPHLPAEQAGMERVLCTGHSCRSQVKRFAGAHTKHPAEILVAALG